MTEKIKNTNHIHQPHDHLVKKLLSNPAAARDILSLYLPDDVLAAVDLTILELQRDSFIDDEHRVFAVDLLYKTAFQNEEGYIWILLEHQRRSDPWLPVRLFKYISIIWDHLRKTSKSIQVPLVYPLIIYNGDKPYLHSLNLSDLIKPNASKELFHNLFSQPFRLIDLAAIKDEELRKSGQKGVKGIALLMALKHVFDRNLQVFFDQILLGVLKQLDQAGDTDEVVDVLYYLMNEGEFSDKNRFWKTLHNEFSEKVENEMTTIAQDLETKGKIEVARRLLAEKMDMSDAELVTWVKRVTGLPIEKIHELQKKH